MINIDNTDRKGIYKNLYSNIQKQNENSEEVRPAKKGIYKNLYPAINSQNNRNEAFTAVGVSSLVTVARETSSIWHKYPLKLMVYSNDFGEAVRPVIGNAMAKMSWLPAIGYTFFALKNSGKKENLGKEIAFQVLASFMLPFLLLKSSRKVAAKVIDNISVGFKQKMQKQLAKHDFVEKFVNKFKRENSSGYRNLALSAVGVGAIAVGAKPIDKGVKHMFEKFGV